MTRIVLVDGIVVDEAEAGVAPLERNSGVGAFEVLRTHDGTLPTLHLHLERLRRALVAMEIDCDPHVLAQEATEAAGAIDGEARVDLRIERTKQAVTRTVVASSFCPPDALPVVSAATIRAARVTADGYKRLAYGAHGGAIAAARRRGCSDALLLDEDGYVREAATANVFSVVGTVLRTAEKGILLGVTRGMVLDLATSSGLTIEFAPHTIESLGGSDEVFLTSAVRGIAMVNVIDGHSIGAGTYALAGALRHQLDASLRRK